MPPRSGNPPRPALALSALALGAASSARAAGVPLGCDKAPWTSYAMCDASLPADARVADMLARMPLKEKINAMYREFGSPFVDCDGNSGIPSLGLNGGIPNYSECLHGVAYGCTKVNGTDLCPTLFPNGMLLGASFNRSLFRNVGRVIGEELRALNNLGNSPSGFSCWSPDLNLARDPRMYPPLPHDHTHTHTRTHTHTHTHTHTQQNRPHRPLSRTHSPQPQPPTPAQAGAARRRSPAHVP